MKWYHWLIGVGIVYFVFIHKKRPAGPAASTYNPGVYNPDSGRSWTQEQVSGQATTEAGIGLAGWYGVGTKNMTPAYTGSGWNPYPGWWRTSDGGWYNPDTGEWYTPGSSPAATPEPESYSHPLVIDLSQPAVGVQPGGNGEYHGEVIY